ncbi:MAG: primosomal protein N' [Candidatus Nomurabacteria bacterium]|jgi:primosomal protein N' (replication factor Y)|nr:primosomal protein N' [Candidatus Nomurabacteria bacterium]
MKFYEVSPIGIVGKDFKVLTYSFLETLPVGTIIEIPVAQRKFVGVITKKVTQPDFTVKEILRVLYDQPLPPALLKLHAWLGHFYTTHPGTVWQTMLPSGLNKNRRKSVVKNTKYTNNGSSKRTNFVFNDEQLAAIDQLVKMSSGTAILHGITGSGKTEVYKALAMKTRNDGKSSIILVPEISLTAQLVDEFQSEFDSVILTHSTMTEAERVRVWCDVLMAEHPVVVIGPRSALFMPVKNLGLIVIDECHEPSYKQEKSPRYNTLRAASVLAHETKSRLILGSATPLITDYYTAQKLDRPIVRMAKLARAGAKKPKTEIVDLTKRANFTSESKVFSRQLLSAMKETLNDNQQILLFHNRRGSASTTLCENCGWLSGCPRCFLPLTLHADRFELRCHICGYHEKPPIECPECDNTSIIHRGIGTKRIEEEIRKIFPGKTIRRFDGDTARGQAVQDIFSELKDGTTDIIIGTQTVAKGLDLPNLRLVGIVQADAGLALPDFSATERTFQLIAQATGRVGRGADDSRVIVQTFQPDAPAVKFGASQDYAGFYNHEIKHRQHGHFPPFAHLLKLTCMYKTEKGAIDASKKFVAQITTEINPKTTKILGPAPAFYERARGFYRWQIIVRSTSRDELLKITKKVPSTKWQAELDPSSLI